MGTSVDAAVEALRRGEVVAFPTESSYGLGALAMDAAAVARVFALKGRAETSPVPVLLPDATWLDRMGRDVTPAARALARKHWPGALTLVVRAADDVPAAVCGGTGNVGLRVPGPCAAADVVRKLGAPVTATSANPTGEPPALTEDDVRRAFPSGGLVILSGPAPGGPPSTVVDVTTASPRVLRAGRVALETNPEDPENTR